MPRDQAPDYIKAMRGEGKPPSKTPPTWQHVLGALQKLAKRAWHLLKGPVWNRLRGTGWKWLTSTPKQLVFLASLYWLLSSFVSLTAGDPLVAEDPFSAPFTLTNTSRFFTLRHVSVSCENNHVEFSTPGIHADHNSVDTYSPVIPYLLPGNQDTVRCGAGLVFDRVKAADVTLSVQYGLAVSFGYFKIPVWFDNKKSSARFVTSGMSEKNSVKWLPYGLNDVAPGFVPLPR